MPESWKKGPRPDKEVVELLERLVIAARKGLIRGIVVVTVDPLLQVESKHAGDMDNVKTHLLIGGMFVEASKITNRNEI